MRNLSKVLAPNGDVHVCWTSKDELGKYRVRHAVSIDNGKTWDITPDKEIEEIMQGVIK